MQPVFPGEVYYLPRDEALGGDPDIHPHVLLTPCSEEGGFVTLAYSSTRPTEKQHEAAAHLVDPSRRGRILSGFDRPTYVYPSRLFSMAVDDLPEAAGRIVDDLVDVRNALRHALGLGTGTGASGGPAAGTLRGQIVTLSPQTAGEIDTRFAIVVTEPRYCWAERNQLIVPIYPMNDFVPVESDLAVEGAPWLRRIGMDGEEGVLAVSQIQSVWHRREIADELGAVIDPESMTTLETALERWFDI